MRKITNLILSMMMLLETVAPAVEAVGPSGDVLTSGQESPENSVDNKLLEISNSLYQVEDCLDKVEMEEKFSLISRTFPDKDSLKTMYVSRDTAAKCLNLLIAGENEFKQKIKSTYLYNTQEEVDERYISVIEEMNVPIAEFVDFLFHMLYRRIPKENLKTDLIVLNRSFPSIYQAVKNVILKHRAENLNDSQDIMEYTFSLSSEFELKEIMEMVLDINGGSIERLWNFTGATGFLSYACYSKNIDIVRIAVRLGGDINYTDCYGCTPLCNAIERNQIELVNLLLENDADPDLPSYRGRPLELAILSGYPEIAEALINGGAEIDEKIIDLARKQHLTKLFYFVPETAESAEEDLPDESGESKQSQSSQNIFLVCLNKLFNFFK